MKLNLAVLVILSLCLVNLSMQQAPEKEGDVYKLTTKNFETFINTNDFVLVKFYAPWCGHCKQLAPEYSKAATVLKNDEKVIALAEVDATEEKDLATKFEVDGYPTLKFFIQGSPMEYTGGRTEEEIIAWCRKRSGASVLEANEKSEIEKIQEDNEVLAVFFGDKAKNEKEFAVFDAISKQFDDVVFIFTSNQNLFTLYGIQETPSLIILKNFDEKRNDFHGKMTPEEVTEFIDTNQFPQIMQFNQKTAEKIFGESAPCLFLFINTENESTQAVQGLMTVADKMKGKILIATANFQESFGERLAEYIGVKNEELPTLRIILPGENDVKKYMYQGPVNPTTIVKFYEDFAANKIKPFFKSQPIPEKNDEPVKVIVADTWESIVLDTSKDVLVKFYAPWCGHCKALAPVWDQIAEKLQKSNPNIVLAKIDATENEIEDIPIQGFPSIKFFPAKDKKNFIEFEGDRTEEGILSFLKEHATGGYKSTTGKTEEL